MKNIYTAYSKVIMGVNHYFVKKFITFPDLKNVPDVLESYGMHDDFERACSIASINDKDIKLQLFQEIQENTDNGRVIQMGAKIINAAQS
jgi:hypothetical protein